jgi:hypothetical protein
MKVSTKSTGEIAELIFAAEAMSRGYIVSKPYGDNAPYDALLHAGNHIYKIQIKSTKTLDKSSKCNRFRIMASNGRDSKKFYTGECVDFVAAYIFPHQCWYLIPQKEVANVKAISLYPHRSPKFSKFEKYRGVWF